MNLAKYGSRKYHLALMALLAIFALAWVGKLDAVASAAILGAAGLYGHFNLRQKREEAEARAEAAEVGAP